MLILLISQDQYSFCHTHTHTHTQTSQVGVDNLVIGLGSLISELPESAPGGSVAAAVRKAWAAAEVKTEY